MLNELIILARIKEGDIKAFEGIFRRYYSPLCWYATGITGEAEAAEEIVEQLFYVLWKDREKIQVFRSLKSYLYRAVRNEAVQYCEHREVKERYGSSLMSPDGDEFSSDPQRQMEYKELHALISRALGRLPARRRLIFNMHRMQGLKYAEIARSLSLSVKTVEAEMTKVLRTLRGEIDNYIRTK
ncbi:RNA polymerase sigma-70 factor [Bacteroides helcogenes]|uniref:RNA polymerase, sigma-24 subunit, ECF subfamily n=1 Tax=Bacteroides helcogenes (strain ATCC 35417 / DSM 20613 / JCM 6297 / CCUG 15421 / P 36-108) TaxID=693979 RepID=E6SNK0_BACT6|nr:RNA polymerase sigma-70 factor [Bacteroides helcogenes]ADV43749.1 RNA polymerase, sigma-24 subunit, ECF subfamily [Bacteroides helcogenes P 36-108]MDY5237382.1 RNA polymerase sigma-70 factor [Bacteroides helcogenes]